MPRRKPKVVKWFDQAGEPITFERVKRHDKVVIGMIKKIFRVLRCDEAAMDFQDLLTEGRLQVMKAVVKFDPKKAIEEVTKQDKRKKRSDEEHLRWKRENPEEALRLAEERWVSRRLWNYFFRLRWNNSSEVLGAKTVSYHAILAKTNQVLNFDGAEGGDLFGVDDQSSEHLNPEEMLFGAEDQGLRVVNFDREQAEGDRDHLLHILETQGQDSFKKALKELTAKNPEALDNLMEFCDSVINGTTVVSYSEEDLAPKKGDSSEADSSEDDEVA